MILLDYNTAYACAEKLKQQGNMVLHQIEILQVQKQQLMSQSGTESLVYELSRIIKQANKQADKIKMLGQVLTHICMNYQACEKQIQRMYEGNEQEHSALITTNNIGYISEMLGDIRIE